MFSFLRPPDLLKYHQKYMQVPCLFRTFWLRYQQKSKTPLQATGYQICSAASSGVFDPRGSRQISMQAWLLGSLLAGIKECKKMKHPRNFRVVNLLMLTVAGIVNAFGITIDRSKCTIIITEHSDERHRTQHWSARLYYNQWSRGYLFQQQQQSVRFFG